MKILIIDEYPFEIENIIAGFDDCEITGRVSDIEDALKLYNMARPDLIIMNVRLGNTLSFSLFDIIDFRTLNIIFISQYRIFMDEVMAYGAIDFVIKPYTLSKMKISIAKARERIGIAKPTTAKLAWKVNRKSLSLDHLDLGQIIKIRSNGSYSNIFMANNNVICASRNIRNYERFLSGGNFIRIHNCCLINMDHIQSCSVGKEIKIKMDDSSEEIVARARKTNVLNCLMQRGI